MTLTLKQKRDIDKVGYKNIELCPTCNTLMKRNKEIDYCGGCGMTFKFYNGKLRPTGKHVDVNGDPRD